MTAALTIAREPRVDFAATARMASAAFGRSFTPAALEWLYRDAFSQGAIVIGVSTAERKVGQLVLLRQTIRHRGGLHQGVLVVDQCVEADHRSGPLMIRIYREGMTQCRAEGIRFMLGVPNATAAPVVERFAKAPPCHRLEARIGLGLGSARRVILSRNLDRLDAAEVLALFEARLAHQQGDGIAWTAETLLRRLGNARHRYGVEATPNVLMLSRPARMSGLPALCILGLFVRPGCETAGSEIRGAIAAACRRSLRPVFVYAGLNPAIDAVPGFVVPAALRRSPLTLHIRDDGPAAPDRATTTRFDRYELIDFDYG
jgi:hypothetical protein